MLSWRHYDKDEISRTCLRTWGWWWGDEVSREGHSLELGFVTTTKNGDHPRGPSKGKRHTQSHCYRGKKHWAEKELQENFIAISFVLELRKPITRKFHQCLSTNQAFWFQESFPYALSDVFPGTLPTLLTNLDIESSENIAPELSSVVKGQCI